MPPQMHPCTAMTAWAADTGTASAAPHVKLGHPSEFKLTPPLLLSTQPFKIHFCFLTQPTGGPWESCTKQTEPTRGEMQINLQKWPFRWHHKDCHSPFGIFGWEWSVSGQFHNASASAAKQAWKMASLSYLQLLFIVSHQVFFQVIFSLDYFSKLFYCMTPQILRQANPYKSSKFSECLKNASNNEIKIVLCKTPKRYHLEDYAFQNRIGLLDCSFSEPTKFTQDNEISK